MTETRRTALKILGTVGATCAFPFAGDELYGQHVHTLLVQTPGAAPYRPAFFTEAEYATLSRLTDVIIPPTDTPGATGAGVPEYIDRVVSSNREHQPLVRAGLDWLDHQAEGRSSGRFVSLTEAQQTAILEPLSREVDRENQELLRGRFRTDSSGVRTFYVPLTEKTSLPPSTRLPEMGENQQNDPRLPVKFFRLIKNLTADGYYTSRIGLVDELGYAGNTALARFPECSLPEQ